MMLYLHIPFCVRKCLYCDFCSLPGQTREQMDEYARALCAEMALVPCEEEITSVFFGGGTPSLLPEDALSSVFEAIHQNYCLSADCEISLEANPGTVTRRFLENAASLGVNRLSFGVQAAQDALLARIGRIHSAEQAKEAFAMAREAGFENLSADLMYALPGQTERDLVESVEFVLGLGAKHVSMYALTIEEDTPFGHLLREGRLSLPDEDEELSMQSAAIRLLKSNGFMRYEVSNFAPAGYACRHNLGYWQRVPYIGLGLSAHGFDGKVRYANTNEIQTYLSATRSGVPARIQARPIPPEEEWEEELMLGLRTSQGVRLGAERLRSLSAMLVPLVRAGFACLEGDRLFLTDSGFSVMNTILVRILECCD